MFLRASTHAPPLSCELEDNDRVGMRPACIHIFHLIYVDVSLQGNANRPLCRADVGMATLRRWCRRPIAPGGPVDLRLPPISALFTRWSNFCTHS